MRTKLQTLDDIMDTIARSTKAGLDHTAVKVPRGHDPQKIAWGIRNRLVAAGITKQHSIAIDRTRNGAYIHIYRRHDAPEYVGDVPFYSDEPIDVQADVSKLRQYQEGTQI